MTLSIMILSIECRYAECRDYLNVMPLSVSTLSVVMLSVVTLNVVMLSVMVPFRVRPSLMALFCLFGVPGA